jgi:DNA (cytosine-5)-methyltransferase 1
LTYAKNNDIIDGEVKMSEYTFADMFAGIGGFRFAFQEAGFRCVFTSEIDKIPQNMYKIIHGDKNIFGDINEVNDLEFPEHDVIAGGFPCQPFSRNGKTRGFEETKGTLFFSMADKIRLKKPKVVLIENVMGLVYHDKYNTISTILKTLSDLGYKVDFEILSSYDFGIPQNRDRVFIVAFRDAEYEKWKDKGNKFVPNAKKTIMEIEEGIQTFNFNFPKPINQNTKLSDFLEKDVDEKYSLSLDGLVSHVKNNTYRVRVGTKLGYEDFEAIPYHTTIDYSFFNSKTRRGRLKQGMIKTLDQKCEIAVYIGDGKFRRLTPLEVFRLQGFQDEVYHKLKNANVKESQLYKRPPRSITIPVVKSIADNIYTKLDEIYNK